MCPLAHWITNISEDVGEKHMRLERILGVLERKGAQHTHIKFYGHIHVDKFLNLSEGGKSIPWKVIC